MNFALHDVSKFYGDKKVLDHISLNIPEGKCLALLGASGCGKTTLLNALAGLIKIDGGQIIAEDRIWSEKEYCLPPEKRRVGMVFQDFALWPHMTIFENVAFGLHFKKMRTDEVREKVKHALSVVQMKEYEKQYPYQLSGGQKQRVAIARALITKPDLMLMDEPLSSLDAQLREKMRWEILRIVIGTGITTVYVTHDQSEALSLADTIVLLNGGHIEQQGTPGEIYSSPATVFAAKFLGCSNLLKGVVTGHKRNCAVVDCQGILLCVSAEASVGEELNFAIRPNDIGIGEQKGSAGTLLPAFIVQRSFQGLNWHYQMALKKRPEQVLEVWAPEARALSEPVELWLPADRCLTVRTS